MFAWCVYYILQFLGLFGVECDLDLFPLSSSEESERKKEALLLQGLLGFLISSPLASGHVSGSTGHD